MIKLAIFGKSNQTTVFLHLWLSIRFGNSQPQAPGNSVILIRTLAQQS